MQVLATRCSNPVERVLEILAYQAVGIENRDPAFLAELLEGIAEQLPLRDLGHPCSVDFRFGHFEDEDRQHLGDHAAEGDGPQVVSDHVRALGVEKGPDEFFENAFLRGGSKKRLGLGADFPAAANQRRNVGVDAGRTEKIQNRFRCGLGWCGAGRAFHCSYECEGVQEDLEVLVVIHGREPRARSAGVGPNIRVAGGLGLLIKNILEKSFYQT